jgi:hypothetical protein
VATHHQRRRHQPGSTGMTGQSRSLEQIPWPTSRVRTGGTIAAPDSTSTFLSGTCALSLKNSHRAGREVLPKTKTQGLGSRFGEKSDGAPSP